MKVIDNISALLKDELINNIKKGSKMTIAASCFSMYAYKELKNQLDSIEVHNINVLTVIASESYDSFAKGLQSEIAEAVAYIPKSVTADLFKGREITDDKGNIKIIDDDLAQAIYEDMIYNGYIKRGQRTCCYRDHRKYL